MDGPKNIKPRMPAIERVPIISTGRSEELLLEIFLVGVLFFETVMLGLTLGGGGKMVFLG